jgi:hypothetical protein
MKQPGFLKKPFALPKNSGSALNEESQSKPVWADGNW